MADDHDTNSTISPELKAAKDAFYKISVNWMYVIVGSIFGVALVAQYLSYTVAAFLLIPLFLGWAVWSYFLWKTWRTMYVIDRDERAARKAARNAGEEISD